MHWHRQSQKMVVQKVKYRKKGLSHPQYSQIIVTTDIIVCDETSKVLQHTIENVLLLFSQQFIQNR